MGPKRAAFVMVVIVSAGGCDKGSAGAAPPSASAAPVVAPEPVPVDPVKQALITMDPMPVANAFAFEKPEMTDLLDEDSPGTAVFALWAARRMRWSDVNVAQDETTPALVKKDSDSARGKRICANGQVIQIKVEKLTTGGHLSQGLLASDAGNIYRFLAAGSSGSLIENSYGHFCGLVTGTYDYTNSAGGTGHAVSLVGMFDLPENKGK